MRKILIATVAVCCIATADAQRTPEPDVPVAADLLGTVVSYLQNGGSHNEGAALARMLLEAYRAPQLAAQREADKAKAVEAARAEQKATDEKAAAPAAKTR